MYDMFLESEGEYVFIRPQVGLKYGIILTPYQEKSSSDRTWLLRSLIRTFFHRLHRMFPHRKIRHDQEDHDRTTCNNRYYHPAVIGHRGPLNRALRSSSRDPASAVVAI